MGNVSGFLRWLLTGRMRFRVIMVGLDSAGKTTVLYRLKRGETAQTIPTIGFNVEELQIGAVDLKVWDVGGQTVVRELWSHYLTGSSSAIVFVLDSTDRERVNEAKDELHELLEHESATKSALLILANKQDLPNALNRAEVADALQVSALSQVRACAVFEISALYGDGLNHAMEWLTTTLASTS